MAKLNLGSKLCLNGCGKDIPLKIKRDIERKKFCSRHCLIAFNKKQGKIQIKGENNPNYKGDKVGYAGLHLWLRQELGKPLFCTFNRNHGGKYVWANKSGLYLRDVSDYHSLCYSCNFLDKIKKDKRFQKGVDLYSCSIG